MNKYVQHISGHGEKWEVLIDREWESVYIVRHKEIVQGARLELKLPKSEYQQCPPPEKWVECTRQSVKIHPKRDALENLVAHVLYEDWSGLLNNGYRWAWKGDALVIERREEAT